MNNKRFYESPAASGARRSAPAALRNREPIADVLKDWLPADGLVLEVASGTGEHAAYFAQRFPQLEWQPSDVHPEALASIQEWGREAGLSNLRPAIPIDASSNGWPIGHADAILNINMAHISPWKASLGLIKAASGILPPGAALILYGPWLMDGVETAPSNLAFDADLKRRNPDWGLRRVEDFAAAAAEQDFELVETRAMPANNRMLLLRRIADPR